MSENDQVVDEPLDSEDWEIAFAPYSGNPGPALTLAFHLTVLKASLSTEPLKIREAVESLDRAIAVLFPLTDFHEVSQDLFLKVIEGRITVHEEATLRSLGVKF